MEIVVKKAYKPYDPRASAKNGTNPATSDALGKNSPINIKYLLQLVFMKAIKHDMLMRNTVTEVKSINQERMLEKCSRCSNKIDCFLQQENI